MLQFSSFESFEELFEATLPSPAYGNLFRQCCGLALPLSFPAALRFDCPSAARAAAGGEDAAGPLADSSINGVFPKPPVLALLRMGLASLLTPRRHRSSLARQLITFGRS